MSVVSAASLYLRGFDSAPSSPIALGIDPDSHGSLCGVTSQGELIGCLRLHRRFEGQDFYLLEDPEGMGVLLAVLSSWLPYAPVVAMERVGAMPGEGRSSVFTFGKTVGQLLGTVRSMLAWQKQDFTRLRFVQPRTWQACFGLRGGAKAATRDAAKAKWPNFVWPSRNGKPDTKITDGAYIAAWGALSLK